MALMDKSELSQAETNRRRVGEGYCNYFYNQQAHAVAQWKLGEPKPESVILGELPYVGKTREMRREED